MSSPEGTGVEALARRYPFTVVPNEHGGYYVRVPDFPNIVTGGLTAAEAATNAVEAIALALEWHLERGRPLPEPTVVPASVAG